MLNIKHVLVPIDFSEHCTKALAHARELAAAHGSMLDLLHVVEEAVFPSFYKMGEEAIYGEVPSLRDRALSALQECVEPKEPGVDEEVEFHVSEGRPGDEIVTFAEERGADLIVISTHGLSGIERILMGSVAQYVVQHASCPVFVVKAKGKSLLP